MDEDMGQPKPKRKTRCNNTNTINATKKSTHRRPVKKRRVISVKELSVTTAFTTSTTTGLPDLVHETNATVMTATAAAATTTTTGTTPCSTTTSKTAVASIGDAIDMKPSATSFVVDTIDTHTKPHSPKNDHENEIDIPNEKDEFEVVPSPPPFARSVAQVIRNNDGNSTNHYFHHEPKLRYPQQEPQYRQCPISSPVATESPFVSTIVTQHGNTNDIVTELSPRFSPSKAKVPHHRRSLASFSYDLPPIHDLVASLSLSSSSLPNTTSVTNEASTSAHKNHNKLLPKSHNCKKSISLMNDVDDDEEECGNETYKTLSTATAATTAIASTKVDNGMIYSRTSSAMFHSNPSDRMDVTSTNPTIPSALMSGKVISTKYGLAMLVVPSSDITVSDYTSTFASSMAVHALTNNNVVSSLPPDTASNAGTCNSHSTATPSVATRFKHWLTSEDELLRYAITKQMHGPPYMWQQIAQTYFPNTRNANQCKSRWKKIDPSLTKNAFTAEEDEIILKGEKDGLSWPDIANQLPGRNSDQVRFRFVNTINPQLMKNVAWTDEEERILNKAQSELGNKWSVITSFLPGRSENDIKNHWHNNRLRAKRKLKSIAASTKRDETLMNLRRGMYDSTVPSLHMETVDDVNTSTMDIDTIES